MSVGIEGRHRVALLGPYPIGSEMPGGVDAVVVALAAGQARRPEIDLHVITAVPGLSSERVATGDGLTRHQVPHPRGDRLLWHLPLMHALQRRIALVQPDVVHAQMPGAYAGAAEASGRPCVISLHGAVFREAGLAWRASSVPMRLRWLLDAAFERWIIRRAGDLIATSPYIRREFQHLTRARFHDIENPVDSRFFAVPADTGDRPSLLSIAALIPRKDILTLLRAFARVRERIGAAELELVGQTTSDPAYVAACRDLIAQLGLGEAVRLHGSLPPERLAAQCARSSLVVLTSRQETAPVAIAVAMAAGRAVVANEVGGVPDMVAHGETGLLTPVGDVDALAAAIVQLLSQQERRSAFAAAGRVLALERFHVDRVVDRTVALYRALEAGRR